MAKRWKLDARYLSSAILLVVTAAAALTGWLADVWDLNDFVLHTYTGYGMAALALVHTMLEWPRLWAYARARVGRHAPSTADEKSSLTSNKVVSDIPHKLKRLLTRRDLISLLVGGAGGFVLGQQISPRQSPAEHTDLGIQYHAWSSVGMPSPFNLVLDWGERPPQYKSYPDAARTPLPSPRNADGLSLAAAIQQRRSIRDYTDEMLSLDALSQLLYATDGITLERRGLRSAPSAGALYPIETYVVAHRVADLEAGVYHYAVQDHSLARVRAGNFQNDIARAGLMQGFLGEANVVLVLTAIFQRLRWKYRERTYRYALLEAGHMGQNVYLAATSMGMGACAVGAFNDKDVNALIGVDGEAEAALYLLAVGKA